MDDTDLRAFYNGLLTEINQELQLIVDALSNDALAVQTYADYRYWTGQIAAYTAIKGAMKLKIKRIEGALFEGENDD